MLLFATVREMLAKTVQFAGDNWPLLVPLILGCAGIYLLLPQARRSKPVAGALLVGLALILGGCWIIQLEAGLAETILFYAFSGIAVVGGVMLITQKNPVHAALSFALVVLSTCGLFLLQAAPFLMAATIIIYAGAIIVTFLFVIMLAQQAGLAAADQRSREPFLASLAGFVLLAAVLCVLNKTYSTRELDRLLSRVQELSTAKDAETVQAVMREAGDRSPEGRTYPLIDALSKYFPGEEAVFNLEVALNNTDDIAKVQSNSQHILALAPGQRLKQGILTPAATLPLSKLSGTPANIEAAPTADGKLPERLPARNVAAIGTALFTDYLVPVLLAGMLLLVATIGAIAIAGRRAEVLR
jgi:NADH:ubiquinone oxidoreductase subunit 6 (subunit J)